jgi:hypothetical protein
MIEMMSTKGRKPAEPASNQPKSIFIEDIPEPDVEANVIGPIIAHEEEVIGDRDEALRWLGTPVRGLGYATPISLLGTKEGAERVDDILGQIEHGIW